MIRLRKRQDHAERPGRELRLQVLAELRKARRRQLRAQLLRLVGR